MTSFDKPAVPSASPVFSVDTLGVTYEGDGKSTIHDCSFEVFKGQTVLLVGPSGCGKSTLAMAIAGIIPRSVQGTLTGRIDVADGVYHPGNIGYVFQDPDAQFCMLTVADEIAFGLENACINRDDMPARIEQALADVGLDVALDARHALFSGGMKQKLAIACALALRPTLLILDEPTANLDPLATRQIFELLASLRARGQTMVIIEHKYRPLLSIIDTIVDMSADGTIAQIQTPLQRASAANQSEADVPPCRSAASDERDRLTHLMPSGDAILDVRQVQIQYGDQPVLEDVSLSLYAGEWVAIVGPNGAGKSSLLEVMGGLAKPLHGEVCLQGRQILRVPIRNRYEIIAYGFQNPEYQFLFERVSDEMAGRVLPGEMPDGVAAALAEFGLLDMANQSPYALSQGQKRRLAVRVMLAKSHHLYLFDEPTYGQDVKSEQMILTRLQALCEQGANVVTVTHDLSIVRTFATRVIAIGEGQILYDGDVEGLFQREDVLTRAHLLDDVRPLASVLELAEQSPKERRCERSVEKNDRSIALRSPMSRMHPAIKLMAFLFIAVLTLFANQFSEVGRMWALTGTVAFGLAWCSPWKLMKHLWVILFLYLISIWTFAANSAVPPGEYAVPVLWFHISVYGLWQGVLVSLRTLATVILTYTFLWTTDGTDFVVSLSQTFGITPKLSYGVMAGTGFLPRIERELRTFRLARRVRGRKGVWLFRPVMYALPMLSQAIRTSERMATAMEARGFYGAPAQHVKSRSYFRETSLRVTDVVLGLVMIVVAFVLFWIRF